MRILQCSVPGAAFYLYTKPLIHNGSAQKVGELVKKNFYSQVSAKFVYLKFCAEDLAKLAFTRQDKNSDRRLSYEEFRYSTLCRNHVIVPGQYTL